MSTPVQPPKLEPGRAYVHVSSHSSPDSISNALEATSHCRLQYIGPVGELKGEHIFEVKQADGQGPIERTEQSILGAIKAVPGVKTVKTMEVKQRAKRDEL